MARDDVRRSVLAAVARGDLPKGGPSEIAAYGLTRDVPPGYWERWSAAAAARIRASAVTERAREG